MSKLTKANYPGINLTPEEEHFNYRLSRARIQVERGLGQHKGRCQCLHKQRDFDPDKVVFHIMTACILHNMWEEGKECYLEEWNSLSESEIDDLQEFA